MTRYRIKAPVKMKLALVADLHGEPTPELYEALENEKPDIVVCAGDLCTIGEYAYRKAKKNSKKSEKIRNTQSEDIFLQ